MLAIPLPVRQAEKALLEELDAVMLNRIFYRLQLIRTAREKGTEALLSAIKSENLPIVFSIISVTCLYNSPAARYKYSGFLRKKTGKYYFMLTYM
jgi:hypothetical protein